MIPSLLWIYDREVGEWLPRQIIVARKRRVGGFDRHESKKNVRLIFALGGEEPCADGHGDDDDQADEDAVPVSPE